MHPPACSDEQFIELWTKHQSVQKIAAALNLSVRWTHRRRRMVELNIGRKLLAPTKEMLDAMLAPLPGRLDISLRNGLILVGADCHYFPGVVTTAHTAFVRLARKLKPAYVILNGDVFDFPGISRHQRLGWDERPMVQQEIECVRQRLSEIEQAAPGSRFIRTLGNHDMSFEAWFANLAPQFEGMKGTCLKDHIPRWEECKAVRVNGLEVEIKHCWQGGVHAPEKNVKYSGISYVTGHLHSQQIAPWTDLRGDRWGVDCGTMAEVANGQAVGPQFGYTQLAPVNWRSGFVVLSFYRGKLMQPELVTVLKPGFIWFRGKRMDLRGKRSGDGAKLH